MAIVHDKQLLDFADPGPLDEAFLDLSGFVNEVTDWTLQSAHSPNRTLAFAGALGLLAHLSGRSYRDSHGTRTNLYFIALGETGIGKEAPRQTNHRILELAGASDSVIDTAASGEGLEDRLAESPSLLMQADETETIFHQMRLATAQGERLSERFRRLFSASSNEYVLRAKANDMPLTVKNPHLTFLGTGTPEAFYDALNERAIVNGLYSRCLVIKANDEYLSAVPTVTPVPERIIAAAKFLRERELAFAGAGITVPMSAEAQDKYQSLMADFVAERRKLETGELKYARAILVRMPEKISKLALLSAISRDVAKPIIELGDLEWATKFVSHVSASMLHEAQFHVSEGKFDRLVKKALSFMKRAGGSIDRTSLLRAMHIDSQNFQRVVLTLHMCDMIEEEWLDRRKVVYTLKND